AALARGPAGAGRGLSRRRRAGPGVRAVRRHRRGPPGVALPAREDGGADHRRQGRHRRLAGGGLPAHDAVQAGVPGPVGDPERAVSTLQSRSGVTGTASTQTSRPAAWSASSTALAIAAGTAMVPASPAPRTPSGLWPVAVSVWISSGSAASSGALGIV